MAKFLAINLNLDEIVTMAVVNELTSKTTKICLLKRTNLSFIKATLTGKTSYFIVCIDKLYFRVRQLCHYFQRNKLLLLGVYANCEHCR